MTGFLLALLFLHPITLPAGWRLPLLIPLVICVALVYRATRTRSLRELPLGTAITSLNIVAGMALIATGFYALHVLITLIF